MEREVFPAPDVRHLITEDGAPVDNVFAEKQMRLLTAPLYASWSPGRPFFAAANVGVFAVAKNPAIVPDVFLSVDVEVPPLTGPEQQRSYFVWEFGKPPDIVIEIVSDRQGAELSDKLRAYERMRVGYYVVFDPFRRLGEDEVMIFALEGAAYVQQGVLRDIWSFPALDLGLTRWDGVFETSRERWLRWTDGNGQPLPTGEERARVLGAHADEERERAAAESARAEAERLRADEEKARADAESARADQERARAEAERARAEAESARAEAERARAEALAARLRALGVEET